MPMAQMNSCQCWDHLAMVPTMEGESRGDLGESSLSKRARTRRSSAVLPPPRGDAPGKLRGPASGLRPLTMTVPKSSTAATTAKGEMIWLKNAAEMVTEMAWRVVAMSVKITGPKCLMVCEMRNCVKVEASESTAMCSMEAGFRTMKLMHVLSSQVTPRTSRAKTAATRAMEKVAWIAFSSGRALKRWSWKCGVRESQHRSAAKSNKPYSVFLCTPSSSPPSVSRPKMTRAMAMTKTSA
mmetsp:Transcript_53515/g.128877  ORF Transcript_53515/g.128877 Transcript_53515/m.128877 type:complete len:239 (+) Transcript_53515:1134-1850(+)